MPLSTLKGLPVIELLNKTPCPEHSVSVLLKGVVWSKQKLQSTLGLTDLKMAPLPSQEELEDDDHHWAESHFAHIEDVLALPRMSSNQACHYIGRYINKLHENLEMSKTDVQAVLVNAGNKLFNKRAITVAQDCACM